MPKSHSRVMAYSLLCISKLKVRVSFLVRNLIAQSVRLSIVKHSNVESSSCSLVAATRKKMRQSASSTEIENVAMDFPFYCIFIKFAYSCYTFIYGEILSMQKDWHCFYGII